MEPSRISSVVCPLLLLLCSFGRQTSSFSTPAANSPEAEARAAESCRFPSRWEGNWFQSGVHQTININGQAISTKGRCLEADGEKYLVSFDREKCYRCVVFHEKHANVLQYKETFCIQERKALKSFCSTITGDASLYSLFRMEPVPIDCPFRGPMTFTYNRGHGECRYPLSTIESCIHPSRLILNYQACPDIPGTESTPEELQCLATWKEGSSRYLLGLMQYRHHASYEERYRCFVYEKTKKGGGAGQYNNNSDSNIVVRVAQSGDATCNGLSPSEGSRTMTLRKAIAPQPCKFPSWLPKHAQWYTLDMRLTYTFEMSAMRVSNSTDLNGYGPVVTSASCSQIIDNHTVDKVVLILYTTSECRSGYMCTAIYKRGEHIVEMQMGNMTRRAEDACHVSNFNQTLLPYVTLVSSTPETHQCPYLGRFQVTGLAKNGQQIQQSCAGYNTLQVGCDKLDTLLLRSDCRTEIMAEFSCHGWWEEMGVSYLVTTPLVRASTAARRYCFVFRESARPANDLRQVKKKRAERLRVKDSSLFPLIEDSVEDEDELEAFTRVLHFSSIPDSCRRNVQPGVDGTLAFNVSSKGECNDVNKSQRSSSGLGWTLLSLWTTAVVCYKSEI